MKKIILLIFAIFPIAAFADDTVDVESYDAEGSVFQKIADLEQEKVLMQLEKEKAQLQLDLDRMAAEQARLAREQESASARAEEQAAEIEKQKLSIEQERQKLEEQKKKIAEEAAKRAATADADEDPPAPVKKQMKETAPDDERAGGEMTLADRYSLVEIIGAGNQLVATVENVGNGKQKKISVGKKLDGYAVRSISIDDGVEFEKDGEVLTIGIGSFGKSAAGE
ncbi:MAG: hypothetical protein LBT45_01785 [Rickettsiales bacterium]|jgi:TolA-binding protein|nr:hypothetical protein [Rickettsiales bacterium]